MTNPLERRASLRVCLLACLVSWCPVAAAQGAAPPPNPNVTPPPASAAPESTAPSAPAPAAPATGSDYECLPTCRDGFVCIMRQCISACNPLCSDGELCTSDGRCVSACNPQCAAGQQCTKLGQCSAPPLPAAPAPAEPAPRVTYIPGAPPPRSDDYRHDGDELSERRRTGKRFHDGFYLRVGLGAGYLISKVTQADETESSGGVNGFTVPVELALGGTPSPGVVLGVGSWAVHVPSAQYTFGRGDYSRTESASYGSISMLGPFIDVYPAPRAGFHVQAAPCFTVVAPGQSDTIVTSALSGVGFGGMFGLGYEGWVSDQWGIGVLARAQVLSATLTDDSDNELDYLAFTPSLLMTTTLH